MEMTQLKQVYEDLFGGQPDFARRCDTSVCFWLVTDPARFSAESRVYVDSRPGGDKVPRRHRPFLTAGQTNAGEFRVLLLTSDKRHFAVSARPCNELCPEFPLYQESYLFEWGRGNVNVVILPAGIIRDEGMVKFCGTCPDSFVLPEGVLDDCFFP